MLNISYSVTRARSPIGQNHSHCTTTLKNLLVTRVQLERRLSGEEQITGNTGTSQASHSVIDPSLLTDLPPISSDDETDTLVLLSFLYFCLFTDYFSHSLAPPSRHSPSTRSLRRVPLPPHTPTPTPLRPQEMGNKGPRLTQMTALSKKTCLTMT